MYQKYTKQPAVPPKAYTPRPTPVAPPPPPPPPSPQPAPQVEKNLAYTSNFLDGKRKVATLFINTVKKGPAQGQELATVNFHDGDYKKQFGEKIFLNEFAGYDPEKRYSLKFLNLKNNMALFVRKTKEDGHVSSFSLRTVTDPVNKANNQYLFVSQMPSTQYPNTYDVYEVTE